MLQWIKKPASAGLDRGTVGASGIGPSEGPEAKKAGTGIRSFLAENSWISNSFGGSWIGSSFLSFSARVFF